MSGLEVASDDSGSRAEQYESRESPQSGETPVPANNNQRQSNVDAPKQKRCCSFAPSGCVADSEELFVLLQCVDWSKKPSLTRDITVGNELWERGTLVLNVGYGEHSIRLRRGRNIPLMKQALQECIDSERSVWIGMKRPSIGMPWCMILRCPCLVIWTTLLSVLGLVAVGVTSAPIALNTDFGAFMNSDSDASLTWNALLTCILDKRKSGGRRLQSEATPNPVQQVNDRYEVDLTGLRERSRQLGDIASAGIRDWSRRLVGGRTSEDESESFDDGYLVLADGTPYDRGRHLSEGIKLYKTFSLELTYAPNSKRNLLSESDLKYMKSVEDKLKQLGMWKKLCETTDPRFAHQCRQGMAMTSVVFPQQVPDGADVRMYLNGTGSEAIPLSVAVSLARQDAISDLVWPKAIRSDRDVAIVGVQPCADAVSDCVTWRLRGQCDQDAEHFAYMRDFCKKTCGTCTKAVPEASEMATDDSPEEVTAMRAHFTFLPYCCTSNTPGSQSRRIVSELKADWAQLVSDIIATVSPLNKRTSARSDGIRVLYDGEGFSGTQLMTAVANDATYALGAFIFVLFYAWLHTRSPFLALIGLFLVLLSIPASLAIFILASGSGEISLMMCLSVFIVIGVGSDMLFVYTDFYKQTLTIFKDRPQPSQHVQRLKYTYMQAATSTAATTFTTAMSFFANLASVLRPLREFGFFMGVCVTSAWFIVLLAYPAVLVWVERLHMGIRRCLLGSAPAPGGQRSSRLGSVRRRSINQVASALDPEKKGVGESHSALLGRLADYIGRVKITLCLLFGGLSAWQAYMAVMNLEQATGAPQILPSDHNAEILKEYQPTFASFNPRDDPIGTLTEYALKCSNVMRSCDLHRCETFGRRLGTLSRCECVPYLSNAPHSGDGCGRYKVNTGIIGREGLEPRHVLTSDVEQLMYDIFPKRGVNASVSVSVGDASSMSASRLETLHWDSGEEYLASMLQAPSADVLLGEGKMCTLDQLCYCGQQACEGSDGNQNVMGSLRLDGAAQAEARALATKMAPPAEGWKVAVNARADVLIFFGLTVNGTNPLLGASKEQPYDFLSSFRLEDPWAQRRSLDMCQNWPEELRVAAYACWIEGFKNWWVEEGEEFPVRPNKDFHAQAFWYAENKKTGAYETTQYLWFTDEGKVKAMYFQAFIDVSKNSGSGGGLKAMDQWDKHIAAFNSQAEAAVKGAIHGSSLWMSAQAEKVILESTLVTISISLGCVLLGVFAFTTSIHLSLIVMSIVMTIVIGLLFFMIILMDWAIGAIEVLSLIVFVGFAVDYCLHLAHKYHSCHITDVVEDEDATTSEEEVQAQSMMERFKRRVSIVQGGSADATVGRRVSMRITDSPIEAKSSDEQKRKANKKVLSKNRSSERFERAKYALTRIGGSIVGSALTTIGSSIFLLPCSFHIFFKLGAVVCGVTIYAVIFALVPLPAVLMFIGPCGHDFQSILSLIRRGAQHIMPDDEYDDEDEDHISSVAPASADETVTTNRRYVLNMPSKGMGQLEKEEAPPTRTRISISG
eukprot:TRINITY_DN28282_c0_g1_i1.p1 TRINITY_DN28282_c0_g1~~TRINITY_DN28282_c0_g1_i1.p1  ORF type:complete len:1528 (+),score=231.61 TRINITY_DN28282_c0_g1_i1:25-4608(+)